MGSFQKSLSARFPSSLGRRSCGRAAPSVVFLSAGANLVSFHVLFPIFCHFFYMLVFLCHFLGSITCIITHMCSAVCILLELDYFFTYLDYFSIYISKHTYLYYSTIFVSKQRWWCLSIEFDQRVKVSHVTNTFLCLPKILIPVILNVEGKFAPRHPLVTSVLGEWGSVVYI